MRWDFVSPFRSFFRSDLCFEFGYFVGRSVDVDALKCICPLCESGIWSDRFHPTRRVIGLLRFNHAKANCYHWLRRCIDPLFIYSHYTYDDALPVIGLTVAYELTSHYQAEDVAVTIIARDMPHDGMDSTGWSSPWAVSDPC